MSLTGERFDWAHSLRIPWAPGTQENNEHPERGEVLYHTAENYFEAFSFLWYAFNAWAACVTDIDEDRAYLNALMQSDEVCEDFLGQLAIERDYLALHVVGDSNPLRFYARQFLGLWPIFEDKSLRRQGIPKKTTGSRRGIVEYYLNSGATKFEPQCWKRHSDEGRIPLDWPHTLRALYKVRCNLFHGEKALTSVNDQRIVYAAFHTLLYFLHSANYIKHNQHRRIW